MTNWEAHKCVIRGELIAQAVRLRRKVHIDDLTTRIQKLELAHKMSQAALSLQELQQTKADLLKGLNKKIKQNFVLSTNMLISQANS